MHKFIGFLRRLLLLGVFILLILPLRKASGLQTAFESAGLPPLEVFARQLQNGNAAELRGIYIPGTLAAPVVQQPAGNRGFISPRLNIVTQFADASRLGSTGLLAHNYLAGGYFSRLAIGQEIHLVYGDGHISAYTIAALLRFRALEPDSSGSSFINLEDQTRLSASELFSAVYGRPGYVVLQTCISSGRDQNWGRLFVIAEPLDQ